MQKAGSDCTREFCTEYCFTDVVAILHGSFVLEWVCTVLVGKVQEALRVHPVESLLVDGMYMTGRK